MYVCNVMYHRSGDTLLYIIATVVQLGDSGTPVCWKCNADIRILGNFLVIVFQLKQQEI